LFLKTTRCHSTIRVELPKWNAGHLWTLGRRGLGLADVLGLAFPPR
jgi:hypothetical protein